MPNNKDYYNILGVSKDASQDEIKSAYRTLAKKYHPDLHPNDESCAQKFKEINEAYEVLGDANKRANYDQFGSAGPNANFGGFGSNENPFGQGFGGGFSSESFGGGFDDIFDMFSSFGGRTKSRKSTVQVPGEDIAVNINLTFKEAVFGCEKIFKVNKIEKCESCSGTGAKNGTEYETCPDCHGTGQVRYTQSTIFGQVSSIGPCKTCNATGKVIREKCPVCNGKGTIKTAQEIKIKIPAGIDNNQVITMRGKGNASIKSGPNGDLIINVSVAPHPILVRDGYDLLLDLPLPFTTAYLGGKVNVPTADDTYTLTIPPLTQPNTVFKLKGRGVKVLQKESYGDLIVTVRVEMPKDYNKLDKDLVQKLEENISGGAYKKFKDFQDKMKKL
jgi:molecular chaperone DnaJ